MGPNQREVSIIVRAYDQVSGAMGSATRGITGFVSRSAAMLKRFALMGTATGVAVGYMARRISASAADLAEQAKAAGVSVEALSRLRIAYDFVGDKAEDADAILAKLNKVLGDIGRGEGREARFVLEALGLSVRDLIEMSPDRALLAIAEAFDRIDNAAQRGGAASAIFGRGTSQQFLRGLVDGSAELRKMVNEAEKFGRVLTDKDAEVLRGLDDDFKRAAGAIETAATKLTVVLAPAISKVLDGTTNLVTLLLDTARATAAFQKAAPGRDLPGAGPGGLFRASGDSALGRAASRPSAPSLDEFLDQRFGSRPSSAPTLPKIIVDATAEMDEFAKATDKAYESFRALMREWSNFEAAAIDGAREIVDMGLNGVVDALTDALTGVKSLKDAFKELGRAVVTELIRIGIRLAIVAGLSALIPGAGGFFGLTTKAKGGTMQGNMVPLGKYATGGIARGPQLALFGEGPGAEAFVPLPDGKTIPVTMRGGRAAEVNITIQAIDTQSGVEWLLENRAAIGQIIAGEMAGSGALRSAVRSVG